MNIEQGMLNFEVNQRANVTARNEAVSVMKEIASLCSAMTNKKTESRIIFKRNFEAYAHLSFIAYKFPELPPYQS
jgi:hypothetical protein